MKVLFPLIFLILLYAFTSLAVEFKVPVSGDTITYKFTPATGTLNDLVVLLGDGKIIRPSNFGGITRFTLNNNVMWVWEGRHTTILLGEDFSGGVYTATFRYQYESDNLDFQIRIHNEGNGVVIDYTEVSPGGKVLEFGFDRSEETPEPRIIQIPYGHQVMWTDGIFISALLDLEVSHASSIYPLHSLYSPTSAYFGDTARYEPCTDGKRGSLQERMYLTVSPQIIDTFRSPANPTSSYHQNLISRVILDMWGNFEQYRTQISNLSQMGFRDLFVIFHVWQKYGYDNGLPSTYPAGDKYGGDAALRLVLEHCRQNGYLFALHTNYVDFYQNSDVFREEDVALNPDGSWVKAWLNPETNIQSYLLKPARALSYAQIYEPQIHNGYQPDAAYLDVHTAVLPSMKVDFDSRLPYCGQQKETLQKYREILSYVRGQHGGPLAGEGFGYSASIWAGYIDAIEADPRMLYQVWNNLGGSEVPLIVDYKLKHLHHLFVPHGVGYLPRFFFNQFSNYTREQMEQYRVTEIAFGNAGFMQDPVFLYPSQEEIHRDYCFIKHIQQFSIPSKVIRVEYHSNNNWIDLTQALNRLLPMTNFNSVGEVLKRNLSRLRITYDNGFVIFINRSDSDWQILHNGKSYRLPPNGFVANIPGTFLAYFASEDNGPIRDYICPAEPICSTCSQCLPNCSGKCGGPDGCGGTCPDTCPDGNICQVPDYIFCVADTLDAGTTDSSSDILLQDSPAVDVLTDTIYDIIQTESGFDSIVLDTNVSDNEIEDMTSQDDYVEEDIYSSVDETKRKNDLNKLLNDDSSGCGCNLIE